MNSLVSSHRRKFTSSYLEIRSAKGMSSIICCPKKNVPLAVRRNRLRRILRECLRASLEEKPCFIRVLGDPKDEDSIFLREQWQQYLFWKESNKLR